DDPNYVDPNMTAIGLMMCVVIALPILFESKGRRGWLRKTVYGAMAVAVIGAALLFESRTSAISIVIGVVFGFIRAGTRIRRIPTLVGRALLILSLLLVAGYVNRTGLSLVISRLANLEFDLAN